MHRRLPVVETGEVHHDPREVRTRAGQSSTTKAALKVALRCRAKGRWRIRLFGPSHETLACCTCLSHRSRSTTALIYRRPQRDGALGEESLGEHGTRTRGCTHGHLPRRPRPWPLPGSLSCGPCRRHVRPPPAAAPAALRVSGACDSAFPHRVRQDACGRSLGLGRCATRRAMRPSS